MPDTLIQSSPAALGVVSDYRSPLIGQLVAARAKAAKEIKTIIKDKKAEIPNKNGGRGYAYSYADLADVMDAVDDALAEQEMAIFQTLQEKGGKPVLVTTLAHSSDQWISSELRVSSIDAGPQVFGSALTYARRYSVLGILGLAPDTDDDGRAAQDRADQARQKPVHPPQAQGRTNPTPKQPERTQRPAVELRAPVHMPLIPGEGKQWLSAAWDLLPECPVSWRREWLKIHAEELAEIHSKRPDLADALEALAEEHAEAAE